MPVSPAGKNRAREADRALDEDRRAAGNDRNRRQADTQGPGGLDQDVSRRLPNTNPGKVGR